MTLLSSIWRRQLVSYSPRNVIPTSFALESFQCVKDDEHLVLGRDSAIEVPPFACRFNRTALGGYLLAIADEDGCVKLLDTRRNGQNSVLKQWSAHTNAVFDVAWMEGEQKLVTASGDQTAVLWDACVGKSLATFKGHSCSLKSINFRENDPFVFTTGARDGNIMIWDVRCNRRAGNMYQPVNTIHNAHKLIASTPQRLKRGGRRSSSCTQSATIPQQSVTAVVFQDDNMLISAGAVDGNIKMWDLRRSYSTMKQDPLPYHTFPYPGTGTRRHGFSSLILDPTQSQLFASCTNDQIYLFSCATLSQQPICSYSGHLNSTFYVKAAVSPDGAYLLSGSSNNDAFLWSVHDPHAGPLVLKGHVGEVTSVAWCPADQGQLVTCSDDNNFRIWRINRRSDTADKTEKIGQCERMAVSEPNSPHIAVGSQAPETFDSPPSTSSIRGRVWSPRDRIITNRRLNRPPSLVGMATGSLPNSAKPVQTCSPTLAANPGHQPRARTPGTPKIFFQDGFPSPPLCPRSPEMTPVPSPARPSSPQALLKSWLKLESRTGSVAKATAAHVTSQGSAGLQQLEGLTAVNVERRKNITLKGKPSNLLLQQDLKDKELGGGKSGVSDIMDGSPTKSPAAKRRCVLGLSSCLNDGQRGPEESMDDAVRSDRITSATEEAVDDTSVPRHSEKKCFVGGSCGPGDLDINKENRRTSRNKEFNGDVSTAFQEPSQGRGSLTPPEYLSGVQGNGRTILQLNASSPRSTILTYFKPTTIQ